MARLTGVGDFRAMHTCQIMTAEDMYVLCGWTYSGFSKTCFITCAMSMTYVMWWIVITQCNKKWKSACDRIDRCPGYLYAEADLDRSILWYQIFSRKTTGSSTTCVQQITLLLSQHVLCFLLCWYLIKEAWIQETQPSVIAVSVPLCCELSRALSVITLQRLFLVSNTKFLLLW